jgi:hypothetical protein
MNHITQSMIQMISIAYNMLEQIEGLKNMTTVTEHTHVTLSIIEGKLYSMMRGLKDLLENEKPENIYNCKEFIRQWEAIKAIAHRYRPAVLHCECALHKDTQTPKDDEEH